MTVQPRVAKSTRRLAFEALEDRRMLAISWFSISGAAVTLSIPPEEDGEVIVSYEDVGVNRFLSINGDHHGNGGATILAEDVEQITITGTTTEKLNLTAVSVANGFTEIALTGQPIEIGFSGTNNNQIYGSEFGEVINGGSGNDLIVGNLGDDRLFGQDGADIIYGDGWNVTTGDPVHTAFDGNDYIEGGAGDDWIYGCNGVNNLYGGIDNDYIEGGDDGNYIWGDAGNDILVGGADSDQLNGGAGSDEMYGGDGWDALAGGGDAFGADEDYADGGTGIDLINVYDYYGNDDVEYDASDVVYKDMGDQYV